MSEASVQLGRYFVEAGHALERGDLAAARRSYLQCLEFAPRSSSVLNNLAGVLILQQDYASARKALEQVIELDRSQAEPWLNLGVIEEEESGDSLRALACFERAVELKPNHAEAHYKRANALARLRRLEASAAAYRLAIRGAPRYASAYLNLGNVLRELRQPQQALSAFEAAIKIAPRADIYCNRGYALRDLGQSGAALKSFDKALRLDPRTDSCAGIRLRTKAEICDWDGWQPALVQLRALIEQQEMAAPPHCVLSLYDDTGLQRQAAHTWLSRQPARAPLPSIETPKAPPGRVRVGYFSADLRQHPVAEFLAGLIEHHDKSAFEVLAFDFGSASTDAMRVRLQQCFEKFIDVSMLSDREAAALAREYQLDIAIDLGGLTAFARPGIFAERAAPVQVGYLGYPGSMAAQYFDYLIADRVLVPTGAESLYQECIARLPHFFAGDYAARSSDQLETRAALGLAEDAFVFACFSNTWKFDPATFASWMTILKRVPCGVLLLITSDSQAIANLRSAAGQHGVDASRVIFGARVSEAAYLGRYRLADLFLDTYPYAAATMAVDALWMGLPLITMAGQSMASRLAASALVSAGLESLVTSSRAQYEDLAVALAQDLPRLRALRAGLDARRDDAPLFDIGRQARDIELLYRAMLERHRSGLAATMLDVRANRQDKA